LSRPVPEDALGPAELRAVCFQRRPGLSHPAKSQSDRLSPFTGFGTTLALGGERATPVRLGL